MAAVFALLTALATVSHPAPVRPMTPALTGAPLAAMGGRVTPRGRRNARAVSTAGAFRFEVIVPAALHPEPVTGRVFVFLARDSAPRAAAAGRRHGERAVLRRRRGAAQRRGRRASSIGGRSAIRCDRSTSFPSGDYYVQAMVSVYTQVRASRRPHDLGPHGRVGRAAVQPGAGHAGECRASGALDPRRDTRIRLESDSSAARLWWSRPTTSYVKRVRIQSKILTAVVGPPDLPRRGGAAAQGLRRASRRPLSGDLGAGTLHAERAVRLHARHARRSRTEARRDRIERTHRPRIGR